MTKAKPWQRTKKQWEPFPICDLGGEKHMTEIETPTRDLRVSVDVIKSALKPGQYCQAWHDYWGHGWYAKNFKNRMKFFKNSTSGSVYDIDEWMGKSVTKS